jgi:hypothetical protein
MRLTYDPSPEETSVEALECWYYHAEREQERHFYDRHWKLVDWAVIGFGVLLGCVGIWAFKGWL